MTETSTTWIPDRPQAARRDLSALAGVIALDPSRIPADLSAHTQSPWYKVERYYQVDNVGRWRDWKRRRDRLGGQEQWCFYACPPDLIEAVLKRGRVLPYGEFFPRVFGAKAIYLFEQPTPAARVALKFGVEGEGYLISCRLAPGQVFRTRQGNPRATRPPQGYDTVMAPAGSDLGSGPVEGAVYAAFDPDQVLIRYVTQIVRADQSAG